jgi:hypothetical protein
MSHFTVMVAGEDVDVLLAPYHEFECTGEDNQYVQDIDQTEEARQEYADHKETVVRHLASGKLVKKFTKEGEYKKMFVREPTPEELAQIGRFGGSGSLSNGLSYYSKDWGDGLGYRAKIIIVPEGYEEVEVPCSEVMTFAEFIEYWYGRKTVPEGREPNLKRQHKYGYAVVNEDGEVIKVIDRTNPNKKWDGYQIGGRWNGFFKLKENKIGIIGEPGLQSISENYKPPASNRADIARKGDIDFDGMKFESATRAAQKYDLFTSITKALPLALTWPLMLEKHKTGVDAKGEPTYNYSVARDEYGAQPMVQALRNHKDDDVRWWDLEDFMMTRQEYIDLSAKQSIMTYALVIGDQWIARGRMGWFGVSLDEKDEYKVWVDRFHEALNALPDDTLLTIVDCHI